MAVVIGPRTVNNSYGALTTSWIAATGETDLTIIGALNTLETDLTTYGLTSKMKALYPFVGGTAAKHKFNFMNAQDTDAAFRLVFNGGWTHSSTGALPNGTNGYANTFLDTFNSLNLNSTHISYYSRTNSNGTEIEIGSLSGAYQTFLEIRTSGTTYIGINQTAPYLTFSDSDSKGLYVGNRTASNAVNGWKNGSKVITGANSSTGLWGGKIFLGALNFDNSATFFTTKQCALASIGDGLTDTEAANFYTSVQTFQTTLGRQV